MSDLAGDRPVTVRPLRREDFPLLRRWLGMPHVQAWWGSEPAAVGIDYLIGEPAHCGRGVGAAAISRCAAHVFALYPDVAVIVAVPQAANYPSRRALEKAGFRLVEERQLDSDDPSDAGPSAIYALTR
jgi:RimJ/RimL family protein N-acetyltransferase